MTSQPAPSTTNTQTVARNSFWQVMESLSGLVGALAASVIVANAMGPTRLATFSMVVWATNVTTMVGSFGLPFTTGKYMAERLNSGERGVARAIYSFGMKLQVLLAALVVSIGIPVVMYVVEPGYRLMGVILVLAMAPRMIGFIPSQANNAAENMKLNTAPAVIGTLVNVIISLLSVWLGWDLVGVAAGFLLGSTLEIVLKLRAAHRWIRPMPRGVIAPELRKRMYSYSGQGLALMVLNIVVWDRSDMFILSIMNADRDQITFFSIAFSLTLRMLMLPQSFAGALAATVMAQYGRGQSRLPELTVQGAKYAFLLAVPLLGGMATVAGPLIHLLYIPKFAPMIPVLALAALLCIPRAIAYAPGTLLQAVENQGYLIWVGCTCGAIDIGLDFLLTPTYGAVGATIANGAAQTAAAIALWTRVYRKFQLDMHLGEFGRIAVSGLAMAAAALTVSRLVPGPFGLVGGILAGAAAWFIALRLTGAIASADAHRFQLIGKSMPAAFRPVVNRCVQLLVAQPGV